MFTKNLTANASSSNLHQQPAFTSFPSIIKTKKTSMKKISILILSILFINLKANSQITKGNWLVGGSAFFSSLNSASTASARFKQTSIQITPLVGVFLKDKFAVGLTPSFTYGSNTIANSNTVISAGPFIRYYFLKPANIVNLFTQGSYSYGIISGKGQTSSKSNSFSISGGPVIYFNSSVGLEFTLNYSATKVVGFSGTNNEIKFGIGFQFHLEKEK